MLLHRIPSYKMDLVHTVIKLTFLLFLLQNITESASLPACYFLYWSHYKDSSKNMFFRFLKKYAPPQDIIEEIDSKFDILLSLHKPKQIVCNGKTYYCKGKNISRLLNAIRLREFIKIKNLSFIDITKKYIYCKHNNCLIIAEKVEEDYNVHHKCITQQMMEELIIITKEARFTDWNGFSNLVFNKNGKLTIIDTEDVSFIYQQSQKKLPKKSCVHHLSHLLRHFGYFIQKLLHENNHEYNECIQKNLSTYAWLQTYIENAYDTCKKNYFCCHTIPIFLNNHFDPTNFNLNIIKKQLLLYQQCKIALPIALY